MDPALELAKQLIARPSVTPDDQGCQDLLAERLRVMGFRNESMPFGEVTNLWSRRGDAPPLLAFAGHTDVVPTGPLDHWRHDPFRPTVEDGHLYGRGAADMKSSIAAFIVACERFVADHPSHPGSIALLLTSDEEGPAVNGTVKVVETLQHRGERIDYCLVGEPSSERITGDTIKNGRRGSLGACLKVKGVQGHVAYPHLAENPVHRFAPALQQLVSSTWDQGDPDFPPTTFQISNIRAGTGAGNIIPGDLTVEFNFRFSPAVSAGELRDRVTGILDDQGINYEIDWTLSGEPFITREGELVNAVRGAIRSELGIDTILSTAGGTSDGRFLAPTGAQVVELGPPNATIHKVNERVSVQDPQRLSRVYYRILCSLLTP